MKSVVESFGFVERASRVVWVQCSKAASLMAAVLQPPLFRGM